MNWQRQHGCATTSHYCWRPWPNLRAAHASSQSSLKILNGRLRRDYPSIPEVVAQERGQFPCLLVPPAGAMRLCILLHWYCAQKASTTCCRTTAICTKSYAGGQNSNVSTSGVAAASLYLSKQGCVGGNRSNSRHWLLPFLSYTFIRNDCFLYFLKMSVMWWIFL